MSYSHKGVFRKPYATLGEHKEAKHCVPNKAVFIPWIPTLPSAAKETADALEHPKFRGTSGHWKASRKEPPSESQAAKGSVTGEGQPHGAPGKHGALSPPAPAQPANNHQDPREGSPSPQNWGRAAADHTWALGQRAHNIVITCRSRGRGCWPEGRRLAVGCQRHGPTGGDQPGRVVSGSVQGTHRRSRLCPLLPRSPSPRSPSLPSPSRRHSDARSLASRSIRCFSPGSNEMLQQTALEASVTLQTSLQDHRVCKDAQPAHRQGHGRDRGGHCTASVLPTCRPACISHRSVGQRSRMQSSGILGLSSSTYAA